MKKVWWFLTSPETRKVREDAGKVVATIWAIGASFLTLYILLETDWWRLFPALGGLFFGYLLLVILAFWLIFVLACTLGELVAHDRMPRILFWGLLAVAAAMIYRYVLSEVYVDWGTGMKAIMWTPFILALPWLFKTLDQQARRLVNRRRFEK